MSHVFKTVGINTITDITDTEKGLGIDLTSATTATKTTMNFVQTTDRTWSWPDGSSTVVGTDLTQTISGKTVYEPTGASVSAAGTNQGTAAVLTAMYNVITTVALGTGVLLPTPTAAGLRCVIVNRGSNILNIFPHSGAAINGLSANEAFTLGVNGSIALQTSSATQWYTANPLLAPSQLPSTVITDTLVADQNDYNPTGLSTAMQLRLTSSGATRTITGLQSFGTALSPVLWELFITNVGTSNNVIFTHESASSTAANRFAFDGRDIVLLPGQSCSLFYDYTSSRWRGIASSQDGYLGGSTAWAGVLTPATLSSDQNDYNPTGFRNTAVLRLNASTIINITGLADPINGRKLDIINIGIIPITFVGQSVLSVVANRFYTSTTLVGGACISLIYDGPSSYWRLTGGTGGATSGAGGLVQSQWTEVISDMSTISQTWDLPYTTINAAGTLPQATITVVRTNAVTATNAVRGCPAFPASGRLVVQTTNNGEQIVDYTGITATTFTGCTGGVGDISVGNYIWGGPAITTIAAGSNNVTLPVATINVTNATLFPASGAIQVVTTNGTEKVTYTGTTGTTFTGCSGGLGTMSTGGAITNVTPSPQDVMTIELVSSGGALIINSTISASTDSNKTGYFQVITDGYFRRGGSTQGNGGAPAGSAVIGLKLSNVPAGYHLIVIKWICSGGVLAVFPVTKSFDNNANLLVQEVSS